MCGRAQAKQSFQSLTLNASIFGKSDGWQLAVTRSARVNPLNEEKTHTICNT